MTVCSLLLSMSSTLRLSTSSSIIPVESRPFLKRLSSSLLSSLVRTSSDAASSLLACLRTELSCDWAFHSSLLFLRP